MDEDYLSHYGVLGMKWGVRKKTESSSGGSGLRSVEEKKKIGEAVNAEAFKKERAKAEKAAEKERKKHESELKKAAKAAAAAAKKAASAAKRGAKAASQKHAENKAARAKAAAERARKKLENQKLREARKAEAERKKKQKEAERAEKKRIADEKKAAKEAEKKRKEEEKKRKEEEKNGIPKGGISKEMRKEAPRHLSSTDLIEQNKRLNLEKQNYELKEKLREYENQNRSVLAKTADLFVDEARKNLTKYAARTATDMLTAALDSKLKGTEYEGIAKMAKSSLNLDAILKNAGGKK